MRHKPIIAITGDSLRHRYFLHQVAPRVHARTAFVEASRYPAPPTANREARSAWNWYFERRAAYEARRFGAAARPPGPPAPTFIPLAHGELNTPATLERIRDLDPGLIVIFGTSLLKAPMLEAFGGRIFNLHLGLSHHYRGSSANFWPIHDGHPETLGATVHVVNPGIDTGAVLACAPVGLDPGDDEQTLAVKTLILGCRLMTETVGLWKSGRLRPHPARKVGRLYRMSDFTPEAVLRVRRMVESGELKQLIEERDARRP